MPSTAHKFYSNLDTFMENIFNVYPGRHFIILYFISSRLFKQCFLLNIRKHAQS